MQTEIDRLVKQVRALQIQQSTILGRLREIEENAFSEEEDSEDNPDQYCYDRYNKLINDNDIVYLITKGKFKERVGKVIRIDCKTKWITIELNSRQTTRRKCHNIRII